MKLGALAVSAAALLLVGGASAGPNGSVLALTWQDKKAAIRLLDAATLAPRGAALPLVRTSVGAHAFSPGGGRLAVYTERHGIRIVELPRMRVVRSLRRGFLTRALLWQSPRRLLVVEHAAAMLIDPASGRTLARREWEGQGLDSARWSRGLVVLASRGYGIGPARLVVVGPGVRVRTVVLDRIAAGHDAGENGQGPFRSAQPGLAVDAAGARAFVAGGSLVAVVDLTTLAVRYIGPERALQKLADGPQRSAAWLGADALAVSGADQRTSATTPTVTPYGLRLVDLSTGAVRMVDDRATSVVTARGLALATGYAWSAQASRPMGLAAYDMSGRLVWQRFAEAQVDTPAVVDGRAYAYAEGAWQVLDAATGRTLGTRAGLSIHVLG